LTNISKNKHKKIAQAHELLMQNIWNQHQKPST